MRIRLIVGATGLLLAGCTTASSTGQGSPNASGAVGEIPSPAGAPLPIIIDTDLAPDDVLAIMALLREPAVDIRAITIAGNGETHCAPGMRNLTWLLGQFGVDDIPIGCGREEPGTHGRLFPAEWRAGVDDFFGVEGPGEVGEVAQSDAVAVLAETLAGSEEPITLVPLGPWTNLADLIQGISTAAQQQSTAASNITSAMDTIQSITAQTSQGANQTAASIGTLAQLAADLRRSVADFKLPA